MLRFFAERRLNHIDCVTVVTTLFAAAGGDYLIALAIFVAGVVISIWAESRLEKIEPGA